MLIDADVMVNVMLFDPEQEEYYTERMTIEETLSLFTEEGRPNPVERPQGKWIIHFDDLFPEESSIECSVCHEEQPLGIDDNYCPNCGARMIDGAVEYPPRRADDYCSYAEKKDFSTADTPQTDLLVKTPHKSRESHEKNCETCLDKDAYDEWEGNCDECENGSMYTPQTDCGWK